MASCTGLHAKREQEVLGSGAFRTYVADMRSGYTSRIYVPDIIDEEKDTDLHLSTRNSSFSHETRRVLSDRRQHRFGEDFEKYPGNLDCFLESVFLTVVF